MGQKLVWFLINQFIRCRFPYVHHIRVEELEQWLKQSDTMTPLLLDARTLCEYQISHLYQAQPISEYLDSFHRLVNLPSNHPIVVYCSIGYRSAKVVEQLQKKGYGEVFNLTGSLFQWAAQGYDLYQGQQVTKQIHPYNNGWQWLLTLMLSDNYSINNQLKRWD